MQIADLILREYKDTIKGLGGISRIIVMPSSKANDFKEKRPD